MDKCQKLYNQALGLTQEDKPDYRKIADLLQSAHDLGSSDATYALATWYLHGEFFDKDLSKAHQLLHLAAENHQSDALYDLAVSYEKGMEVEKCESKAFELYLKAALLGDKQSIYEVGRCYFYGIGVPIDKNMSKIYLEIAEYSGIEDQY